MIERGITWDMFWRWYEQDKDVEIGGKEALPRKKEFHWFQLGQR